MGNNGDKKDNEYWKRKYDSLITGLLDIEEKLRKCVEMNTMLILEKKQWELDKLNQHLIIQNAINNANIQSQLQGEEIRNLREELRQLKGN